LSMDDLSSSKNNFGRKVCISIGSSWRSYVSKCWSRPRTTHHMGTLSRAYLIVLQVTATNCMQKVSRPGIQCCAVSVLFPFVPICGVSALYLIIFFQMAGDLEGWNP
jgi:hypothetical protein